MLYRLPFRFHPSIDAVTTDEILDCARKKSEKPFAALDDYHREDEAPQLL